MNYLLVSFTFLILLFNAKGNWCESFCRFRFCANLIRDGVLLHPENRALLLGLPDAALGPIPCLVRKNQRVVLLSNVTGGEATVSPVFSEVPFKLVSQYEQEAAGKPFPTDYFKWVDNDSNGRQSVARRPSQAQQDEVIDQVCVRMPISSYEIRRRNTSARKRKNTSARRACIGFRTQVPALIVDFEWSSSNDFDIRLVEPNGFEINRFGFNTISPNKGRLIADVGGPTCQVEFGREQIRYLRKESVVDPGVYEIRVDHLRACSTVSSYKLRVLLNGRIMIDERGLLSEVGEDVVVRTFEVPE